jgi:hypothetical protein
MTTRTDRGSRPDPERELVAWRTARLRDAGFDETTAAVVAGDRGFDLHAMLDLIDRGCPPHLAARILAPLEREWDLP